MNKIAWDRTANKCMQLVSTNSSKELPQTCCMIVGNREIRWCKLPAKYWYRHNDDICSYCELHNYVCGEPILPL